METLKRKVKKELDTIAEKGLSSNNLEATNKLVDIYKDLMEICEMQEGGGNGMYDARSRGSDGRYRDHYPDWDYDARGGRSRGGYNDRGYDNYGHYPYDERYDRYFNRMREGMENYSEGRNRYRDGGSNERMVEGIEMTMGAIVNFIEALVDLAETQQEKEIVRKSINKIKNI